MQVTKCDKCLKEIVENQHNINFDNSEIIYDNAKVRKSFELCDNCYQTLVRVVKEYLPE